MSLPLELSLRQTADGPRLAWQPVEELKALRRTSESVPAQTLVPGALNPLAAFSAEGMEVVVDFTPSAGSVLQITARGIPIRYESATGQLTVAGHRTTLARHEGRQRLRFYVDRTCAELFAAIDPQTGAALTYVPVSVLPKAEARGLEISALGGPIELHALEAFELGSIWKGNASTEPKSGR